MWKANNLFYIVLLFFSVAIIYSCSRPTEDESSIPEENNDDEIIGFSENFSMTYELNGVEQQIDFNQSFEINVYTDEVDGFEIKRIEIDIEDDIEFYPSILIEVPFKTGDFDFGTTYGEFTEYTDFIEFSLSDSETYKENTEYAYVVEENWTQPWFSIESISNNSQGEYEVEAKFGGTLINYNDDENATPIQINAGNIKFKVIDNYPDVIDYSANISTPPVVGTGTGGTGQNNIVADFEFRIPGSYISGTQMLFDTASIRIENKSSNAQYFEWELASSSTNYSDSYFYKETQIASPPFSTLVYLDNTSDSSRYSVSLTAYDNNGNSKTVIKSVSLPMIKGEIYLNGNLIERGNIYYNENGEGYLNSITSSWTATGSDNEFWFATEGVFPSDGTFLSDFHQRQTYPFTDSDDEFFVKIGNKWTFSDPNGSVSSMSLDNLSVKVRKANNYRIIGLVTANFTLAENGEGETESGNLEIRYLAPRNLYFGFKKD